MLKKIFLGLSCLIYLSCCVPSYTMAPDIFRRNAMDHPLVLNFMKKVSVIGLSVSTIVGLYHLYYEGILPAISVGLFTASGVVFSKICRIEQGYEELEELYD